MFNSNATKVPMDFLTFVYKRQNILLIASLNRVPNRYWIRGSAEHNAKTRLLDAPEKRGEKKDDSII